MTEVVKVKFSIGDKVKHRNIDELGAKNSLVGYRGVIVDVDPVFMGSEQEIKDHANAEKVKNEPWYHIVIDNTALDNLDISVPNMSMHDIAVGITVYAPESQIKFDTSQEPITHPLLEEMFVLSDGEYRPKILPN